MKKIISFVCLIICLLSLCSCSNNTVFGKYDTEMTLTDIQSQFANYDTKYYGENAKTLQNTFIVKSYEWKGIVGELWFEFAGNTLSEIYFHSDYDDSRSLFDSNSEYIRMVHSLEKMVKRKYGKPDAEDGHEYYWYKAKYTLHMEVDDYSSISNFRIIISF